MKLFLKLFTSISLVLAVLIFCWSNLYVTSQDRNVTPFNSIYISGPINVYLTHAQEESVKVRADTNILEQIIVEVIDGDLRIYTKGRIQRERVLDVYINYIKVDSIKTSGTSTLTSYSKIKESNLYVEASGASEVKLQLESSLLNLTMNNAANVQLAGLVEYFDLKINHVGDLMAYNLVSQNCKAVLNTGKQSPGIARINVQDTLAIEIKGPRHLKYKGNPVVVDEIITDDGRLMKY